MADPVAGNQPAASGNGTAVDPHVQKLIARYGTAENACRVLARENKRYRDAAKDAKGAKLEMDTELTAENADLLKENARLSALVPAPGTVVLTAEQKAEWDAYVALGPSKDVKDKVERGAKAEADLATERAASVIPDAAKALGGLNDDALKQLLTDKGLHVEMKDGKPVVRKADDAKAATEALADVLAKPEFKMYEPMLRAPKVGADGKPTGNNNPVRQPIPRMGGGDSSKGGQHNNGGSNNNGSAVQAHIDRMNGRRAAAINPLRSPAPAAPANNS